MNNASLGSTNPPAQSPIEQAPVSVITTVRNGAATLPRTISSVRDQRIAGLEYVIMDAGSTDGTLDVIRTNLDAISTWRSEPDKGISDGFNKGILLASGKYVALLNADDWFSPSQIASGVETLDRTGADFVFGDLLYHATDGTPLYLVKGDPDYASKIGRLMPALNHPTVIIRRTAYERHGLFDLRWRLAMDYELLLRFHKAGCRGVYDPRILGHMTLAGASDRDDASTLREVRDIAIFHGQSRSLAQSLYIYRRAKSRIRRRLEMILPNNLSVALRHLFNRSLVKVR